MSHDKRHTTPEQKQAFLKANPQIWKELRAGYKVKDNKRPEKNYLTVEMIKKADLFSQKTSSGDAFKIMAKTLEKMTGEKKV